MDNKSVISSSSVTQRKGEFSIQTIVQKIDKDITELIADVQSRIHKNKLQSINDSLKILYKKINTLSVPVSTGGFDANTYSGELKKLKEDIEKMKIKHEEEVRTHTKPFFT